MKEIIKIAISLSPVFIFLLSLIFLDSFKLVKPRAILRTILVGCLAAVGCLMLTPWILQLLSLEIATYSRYFSPILEESLKSLYLIILFKRKKIGFLVDAAIYGFAIGAGFAFVENIYYLQTVKIPNLLLWIIRGFGTAVMHGGTTSMFAILSKSLSERHSPKALYIFLPGLLMAIFVHSLFNHFILPPVLFTISQLIVSPLLIIAIFQQSEKSLKDWLEVGFDTDVQMLEMITSGNFSLTPSGRYLQTLQRQFSGEIVVDMLCLIRLHLELAVRAKGILMMRQAGFRTVLDPEIKDKFNELKFLEKSIGKTGQLALSPILRSSTRDLWQLYILDRK